MARAVFGHRHGGRRDGEAGRVECRPIFQEADRERGGEGVPGSGRVDDIDVGRGDQRQLAPVSDHGAAVGELDADQASSLRRKRFRGARGARFVHDLDASQRLCLLLVGRDGRAQPYRRSIHTIAGRGIGDDPDSAADRGPERPCNDLGRRSLVVDRQDGTGVRRGDRSFEVVGRCAVPLGIGVRRQKDPLLRRWRNDDDRHRGGRARRGAHPGEVDPVRLQRSQCLPREIVVADAAEKLCRMAEAPRQIGAVGRLAAAQPHEIRSELGFDIADFGGDPHLKVGIDAAERQNGRPSHQTIPVLAATAHATAAAGPSHTCGPLHRVSVRLPPSE